MTESPFKKVADKIRNPKNWTQGCLYRDGDGRPCYQGWAESYCMVGAVEVTLNNNEKATFHKMIFEERIVGVAKFNDNHTHQECLDLLDRLDKVWQEKYGANACSLSNYSS